ncbi:MAG: aspartate--tRNA ligase [Planctomycetes bacterium]|nr:aspartate--tRNA ligase [Planctomycetota bacterium]
MLTSEILRRYAVPTLRPNKYRTHTCGELRETDVGKEVVLSGWVESNRDMGGVIFIDLRDRHGITQCVFDPKRSGQAAHDDAAKLRGEWVVRVKGTVGKRPPEMINTKLETGLIEVDGTEVEVLNEAKTPPIEIRDDLDANEDVRLKYRYLDLRRGKMQRVLKMRHKAAMATRNFLTAQGFTEVETPFMIKWTPGGARPFLVPSRLNLGKFYALAESPQLFKQLLMVAGTDRYYQIVRCFRDEDLRIDRQPEFTQVDLEMSFVEQDDIFTVVEGIMASVWKDVLGIEIKTPFERVPYDTAMARWGNDKPDRRFGLEHVVLTDLVKKHDGGGIKIMKTVVDAGGIVKGIRLPKEFAEATPRAQIDKLETFVKGMGAKGLAWARIENGGSWGKAPLAKAINDAMRTELNAAMGAQDGDLLFFQFGPEAMVQTVMANLRLHLGKKHGLIPEFGSAGTWDFFWVVDPPLFEYDEEAKKWAAAHHAFTMPRAEDMPYLQSDPGRVKCTRYDLVLNGYEIAGGSVRIHRGDIQSAVFRAMGIDEEEVREKFAFLLDAFQYGAPPHGGIAVGWDRLVWLLTETEAMRDVFAFPKNNRGVDMMNGSPAVVDAQLMKDVAIQSVAPEEEPAEKPAQA